QVASLGSRNSGNPRIRFRCGSDLVENLFRLRARENHKSKSFLRGTAAPGIDNVDLPKAGGNRAVRHRGDLLGLALSAVERAAEMILVLPAQAITCVPEIDRVPLVRHVPQHLADLAIFDLVKNLPRELEIVALLVNAPTPVAQNVNAILDLRAQLLDRNFLFARLKRNVRHALKRIFVPAIRKGAGIGSLAAD